MSLPKVVVTRTISKGAMDAVQKYASKKYDLVLYNGEGSPPKSWLLDNVKGASGILCSMTEPMSKDIIDAAGSNLKTIATFSAGYDHIDVNYLKSKGVTLGTSPTALTESVADIGALLAVMSTRRIDESIHKVREGQWPKMPWSPYLLAGHSIQGMTLGVFGFGLIGQLTAKRLVGFGIKRIIYTTSKPGKAMSKDHFNLTKCGIPVDVASSLDELASESDIVLTTASLSKDTFHAIGKDFFSKMKKGSYVVNTGRGPLIDTEALIEALNSGQIVGAGLDVLEGEPNITADHPLVKDERVILLPHIGSATYETRDEMGRQAAQNLFAGLGLDDDNGKPIPWVTQIC